RVGILPGHADAVGAVGADVFGRVERVDGHVGYGREPHVTLPALAISAVEPLALRHPLSSLPLRRPLLEEGPQALDAIPAGERRREGVDLAAEPRLEPGVARSARGSLGLPQRQRPPPRAPPPPAPPPAPDPPGGP